MNITDIKPFVMWAEGSGRNWMFVKVETDEGIHGWGEGGLVNQATTIAEAVHMLAPQIVGRSAFDIERAWQLMYLHNRYRNGVIISSALSAIDQALWDIKGKALGRSRVSTAGRRGPGPYPYLHGGRHGRSCTGRYRAGLHCDQERLGILDDRPR